MDYSVENIVANNLINLGKKRLSKQRIISVNRLGQVQLKGNLDKKVALAKLEEIVQQEDARAREWLPEDLALSLSCPCRCQRFSEMATWQSLLQQQLSTGC